MVFLIAVAPQRRRPPTAREHSHQVDSAYSMITTLVWNPRLKRCRSDEQATAHSAKRASASGLLDDVLYRNAQHRSSFSMLTTIASVSRHAMDLVSFLVLLSSTLSRLPIFPRCVCIHCPSTSPHLCRTLNTCMSVPSQRRVDQQQLAANPPATTRRSLESTVSTGCPTV